MQVCTPTVFLWKWLSHQNQAPRAEEGVWVQTPELGREGSSSLSVYSYLNIPQNDMSSDFRVHNMKGP